MKLWPILHRRRWPLLVGGLTVFAVFWLLTDGPAMDTTDTPPRSTVSAPVRPLAPGDGLAAGDPAASANPSQDSGQAGAAAQASGPVDIFAVRTWDPPAPVEEIAAATPPPPPQAPPLPFRYAGKIEEPGKPPVFFLAKGEQMLSVSPGDLVKGGYRVGKIEGGQLHFLYRPMQIRQSIPVGGGT